MAVNSCVEQFNQKVIGIEKALNAFVETGTDEELFLSGYLHGHFSLVVSQAQLSQQTSPEQLDQRMQESLNEAFQAGELEEQDQRQVLTMWQSLLLTA